MTFASNEDLADYLHCSVDDLDLGAASVALLAADAAIRAYTGQTLSYVEDDEITLDGPGTNALLLPQLPVVEVTSVEVDGEALEEEDYTIDLDAGIVKRDGSFGSAHQSIGVTYTHGFQPGETALDDLRVVGTTVAGRVYVQAGTSQQTVGGIFQNFESTNTTLTEGEKAILDQYRDRR